MTRANFGWRYPPGVTGNEYAIAGPDYQQESKDLCPYSRSDGEECGVKAFEEGYRNRRWLVCDYGHVTELPPLEVNGG